MNIGKALLFGFFLSGTSFVVPMQELPESTFKTLNIAAHAVKNYKESLAQIIEAYDGTQLPSPLLEIANNLTLSLKLATNCPQNSTFLESKIERHSLENNDSPTSTSSSTEDNSSASASPKKNALLDRKSLSQSELRIQEDWISYTHNGYSFGSLEESKGPKKASLTSILKSSSSSHNEEELIPHYDPQQIPELLFPHN